ncbi:MAG: hypothetical protein LBS55_04345 [Prevotellaceae bacterium]|jgi:hypothetical protein|nr:hypothetical protein [Prevotellaceae bacterium]
MKKCALIIIGLHFAILQLYAQPKPSRIEKKSFSNVTEVRFEHSYGNITVTESESKQIELEIQYFDRKNTKPVCDISVAEKTLNITTKIPHDWNDWNFGNNNKIGIDYIISIPRNVDMNVNLKYGNMNIDNFYGDFTGAFAYGNLNAGTFFSSPVNISSKYSNIRIDKADVLNLSIYYANIDVNTINTFEIQSKYCKSRIGKSETVKADCSYGNIDIDSVIEFSGELRYNPASVKKLDKTLNLDCSYSSVRINDSSKQLETVNFDGSYSNLELKLDPDLSADLSVDLKYGALSVDNRYKVKYSFSEKDHREIVKKGVIGDKTPTATINISNSYANVSIIKN